MNCKKCGRQVEPNQKFCAGCGNNLQDNSPVYNQNQQQYQQPMNNYQQPMMQQPMNQQQNKKFTKSTTIILTVVGIVIVLVYGLFFKGCYDTCSYFTNDCYPSQC